MWRQLAILIVCSVVVLIAVWISTTPAPERLPDPSRAVRTPETCVAPVRLPANGDEWGSWFFTRAKEPRLDCGPMHADEAYRFTWAHAFAGRHPITALIMRTDAMVTVITSEYRFEPPSLLQKLSQSKRQISTAEWTRVRTMLANIEFWQMERDEVVTGFDGSTWTIEGRVGRSYHRVWR